MSPGRRPSASLRPLLTLALALGVLVAMWLYVQRSGGGLGGLPFLPASGVGSEGAPGKTRYRPLTSADRELMRRQRAWVDEQARRYVGMSMTGRSLEDLRALQILVDRALPAPDQTWQLQALGVVLGDVMAAQLGLTWVVLEDDLGRSRALRLDETDVVLFPVTMISKRVELDVPFRVEDLYQKAVHTVESASTPGSGG